MIREPSWELSFWGTTWRLSQWVAVIVFVWAAGSAVALGLWRGCAALYGLL